MRLLHLCFLSFLLISAARADSPLTSTEFFPAYRDLPIVVRAEASKVLDDEMARYLSDSKNAIDGKAALINALGWNFEGQKNAARFRAHLARQYKKDEKSLRLSDMTPDEVFALGYLTALDDYFHTERAANILARAAERNPTSYTVVLLTAVTKAQEAESEAIWPLVEQVLNDKLLKFDMKPEARDLILEYLRLYQ